MEQLLEEFIEKISRESLNFGKMEGKSRSLNSLLKELTLKSDEFAPNEGETEE